MRHSLKSSQLRPSQPEEPEDPPEDGGDDEGEPVDPPEEGGDESGGGPEAQSLSYPNHVGGGYYELSNGERVQGKDAAEAAEQEIEGE